MPLDLIVPDLLLPPEAPAGWRELRLPALERWLARADMERVATRGANAWLAEAFALPGSPAVAAISLAADEGPREGSWVRADPVHLRVSQETAALHGAAVLGVGRDEAAALVAELQALFASDGFEFVAPVPDRWYVRVPEAELPRTTALEDALGRNVFGLLPQGSGRINWPSAITETQMVFSGHPVNAARESEGRPAINSVWFWGEGALPAKVDSPYALIYANDPFALGLGKLSATRSVAPPANLRDVDAVREKESVLVVLDQLASPLQRGDEAQWKRAAQALEEGWFLALGEAIERFETVRIILSGASHTRVATLTAGARWRFFRTSKPLCDHG
ncbi:MAG: hypothetical protein ACXWG9_03595 [Usitatibacter sp.]